MSAVSFSTMEKKIPSPLSDVDVHVFFLLIDADADFLNRVLFLLIEDDVERYLDFFFFPRSMNERDEMGWGTLL